MNVIKELVDDLRFVLGYRQRVMPFQKQLDRQAPKAGDLAPDFTLTDSSGTDTIKLSQFQGVRPVALIFGSFT